MVIHFSAALCSKVLCFKAIGIGLGNSVKLAKTLKYIADSKEDTLNSSAIVATIQFARETLTYCVGDFVLLDFMCNFW